MRDGWSAAIAAIEEGENRKEGWEKEKRTRNGINKARK